MLLYVRKPIERDVELKAYNVHGEDCSGELMLTYFGGLKTDPEAEGLPCFFKLNEEQKKAYGTKADYAITKNMYNASALMIKNGWRKLVDSVSEYSDLDSDELVKLYRDKIPPQMMKHLF